jgi:glycyl-tRNA synthetase
MTNEKMNFQSMILALHHYWDEQGCLIWHPYYSQVGAGTMNPATFLRVLGPEPWNVGYVEPSVRPDDGRYGDNPNRLQMFYQYQVILKPDPGNPQELYLGSLEAIGIDPKKHDIRFVEDNWEQPAIGAWGLGWEVWLDGLEITQFTYFQQVGKQELNPVSVEITYGLDRIAAPLQGTNHFKDIQWNQDRKFGDLNMQGEQEHSKYYFEIADVNRTRQMYELAVKEVEAAIEADLILPAYDNLLKLSHWFNVLDTRGAIGVTERAQFFKNMRNLAGNIAEMYIEDRQQQEFPWMDETGTEEVKITSIKKTTYALPEKSADFILEIGTEELPPSDLDNYIAQLEKSIPAFLKEARLEFDSLEILGTPRRLVVLVKELSPNQPDRVEEHKGPPASRAFGPGGEATKAAEGFARGKGVSVEDLKVKEIDGGEYIVVSVEEKGKGAIEVLAEALPDLIANLKTERTMRWNSSNIAFSRPIRWILALFGEEIVPFEFAEMNAEATTRGLRFNNAENVKVKDAQDYLGFIKKQGIVLDVKERKQSIAEQVNKLAAEVGGKVEIDEALLAEITHLVEAPTALIGQYEEEHLKLPKEVLVTVMKKHQRYFPVQKDGKLLPYFVTVKNGDDQHLDLIAEGNANVVRARFADAAFFVEEDLKQKLEDFLPRLDTMTFEYKLGSMRDKTNRVTSLVSNVAGELKLDDVNKVAAKRAAELFKADLATNMVTEMTSLQGTIGQQYAVASGEDPAVADAIFEHYLPRFSGDMTTKTEAGLALGIADRLDSLVGLFTVGLGPTGNKDPFALRRAALGLVQNLVTWNKDFDLRKGLEFAQKELSVETTKESLEDTLEFILGRMRSLFAEEGFAHDVVDAVLTAQGHNPASAKRAIIQLSEWVKKENWDTTLDAYARCVRITRDKDKTYLVDKDAFKEEAEKALHQAVSEAEKANRASGSVDDFLAAFTPLIPAVSSFFDQVMVMDEDQTLRENRLGLLQKISALVAGVADLSKLEGF